MKAVRAANEIVYIGSDYSEKFKLIVDWHKARSKEGSWHAFHDPLKFVFIVDKFHATDQYFLEVEQLWLWIENHSDAWDDIMERRSRIFSKRKTDKGRWNYALDQGRVVLNKWRPLHYQDLQKCSDEGDNIYWSFSFSETFYRVFANWVVGKVPDGTSVAIRTDNDIEEAEWYFLRKEKEADSKKFLKEGKLKPGMWIQTFEACMTSWFKVTEVYEGSCKAYASKWVSYTPKFFSFSEIQFISVTEPDQGILYDETGRKTKW